MSSILRALRKLDHDSLSEEPGSSAQKIKMKQVLHRRAVNPRQVNRVLAVVLVIALGAVAWLLIDSRQKPLPIKKQEFTLNKSAPAPLPQQARQHTPQQAPQKIPQQAPLQTSQQASRQTSQQASQQTSLLEKETKTKASGEIASPLVKDEPARSLARSVVPGSGLTPQPGNPKHPQLSFSGVLWSDKPERRVALINDRYLKEGDEIDGVTVVKIEKLAITLQRGAEKWTLQLKK